MRITRALQRVKKQAKRGGLGALRSGLGEELRSGSIPAPLRGAARKIAALIDPGSKARHSSHKPGSSATQAVERTHSENLRPVPPEHANKVGSDRGDAPLTEPEVPANGTEVDPVLVGATPVFNATPIEVEPVDASPADVAAVDATPVTLDATAIQIEDAVIETADDVAEEPVAAPAPVAVPTPAKPKAKGKSKQKAANGAAKKPAAPVAAEAKEKLAPSEEAARSAARSGPKGAAKRPGGQGGKTSKKK